MNTVEKMEIKKELWKFVKDVNEEITLENLPEGNIDLAVEFGFDSLMLIELITLIEEQYGFEFDFETIDIEGLYNFEELVAIIEQNKM